MLNLISADDLDTLGPAEIHSHGAASPVLLFSRRSHLLLDGSSNRSGGHAGSFLVLHPGCVDSAVQGVGKRGRRRVHRGKYAYVTRLTRGRTCDLRAVGLWARLGATGEGLAVLEFFQLLDDVLKLSGAPLDDCLLVVDDLFQVWDLVTEAGHQLVDALQHFRSMTPLPFGIVSAPLSLSFESSASRALALGFARFVRLTEVAIEFDAFTSIHHDPHRSSIVALDVRRFFIRLPPHQ